MYVKAAEKGRPGNELIDISRPMGYQLRLSCQLNHAAYPFSTTYSVTRYWNRGSMALKYMPHLRGRILKMTARTTTRLRIEASSTASLLIRGLRGAMRPRAPARAPPIPRLDLAVVIEFPISTIVVEEAFI